MAAYYNENEKFAAAWLRQLIKAGLIADGEVDERSIVDVRPDDVRGFTQCHWFAGIGGWSYALRLAGWGDDRRVWTGSCPCQPFSAAGKGAGADDFRDLWPAWFQLITECRPAVVFGEQVASADGLGWLDRVSADVEAKDYAIAAVDLCAPSVGAFHIRQRLWFVADTKRRPAERHRFTLDGAQSRSQGEAQKRKRFRDHVRDGVSTRNVAHPERHGRQRAHDNDWSGEAAVSERSPDRDRDAGADGFWRDADWLSCIDGKARPVEPGTFPLAHGIPARVGRLRGYGNAIVPQVAQVFIEAYMEARGQS